VSKYEQGTYSVGQPVAPKVNGRVVTRLGYVSLVDAAPLFVAADLGMFARQGLKVALHREVGWATIREKMLFGELDAAHALCPMPFAATLGMSSLEIPCVAGMVLSKGGNAIVLSESLWKRGVRDGASLRQDVLNSRCFRKYIFATVYSCSTHHFLLRDWLKSAGIDPERDVQLVTLPPSQMVRNLAAGTIDGFCAGEPWPSLAISQGIGWSPATSVDINPGHPEKVLMAKEEFAEEHSEELEALVAALIEACAFCDAERNRDTVASIISDRRRVACDEELLRNCLYPKFDYGMGRVEEKPDFMTFYTDDANEPRAEDAYWILEGMASFREEGISEESKRRLVNSVFRNDIYKAAAKRIESLAKINFPLNPIKNERPETFDYNRPSCG